MQLCSCVAVGSWLCSDCMNLNIMMDSRQMYPEPFHPCRPSRRLDAKGWVKHRPRTECPPRYLFIDFGISRRYPASQDTPLEPPIWGGYKGVPEFQTSNEPCNPFPTDVWYLGFALQQQLLNVRVSFSLLAYFWRVPGLSRPGFYGTVDLRYGANRSCESANHGRDYVSFCTNIQRIEPLEITL
jgi:hypothetical protein